MEVSSEAMPAIDEETGCAVRTICLLAVLLALPLNAEAQRRAGQGRQQRGSGQANTAHQQPARPPSSLGPIGLPPIGLPPANLHQIPWWEKNRVTPRQHTPTFDVRRIPGWQQGNVARAMLDRVNTQQQLATQLRHGEIRIRPRSRNYQSSVIYVVPGYGGSFPMTTPYEEPQPQPQPPIYQPAPEPVLPMGALRLEVEPSDALQIFVDGVYVGTPSDLGGEFDISSGTHHVDLRARGYKTLSFDVSIVENRTVTYRGTLERDGAAPAAPAPVKPVVKPAGSRTMYVIPGCYMGNVSPKEVALPSGCDISKVTTISPQP
jgi:hypothetical protein